MPRIVGTNQLNLDHNSGDTITLPQLSLGIQLDPQSVSDQGASTGDQAAALLLLGLQYATDSLHGEVTPKRTIPSETQNPYPTPGETPTVTEEPIYADPSYSQPEKKLRSATVKPVPVSKLPLPCHIWPLIWATVSQFDVRHRASSSY